MPEVEKGNMDTDELSDLKAIRRAQNRESQKNFRARQAMRVQCLEAEVTRFQGKCQALEKASANKIQEIKHLNACIEQLVTEIESLKNSQSLSVEEQSTPQNYDGFNVIFDNMAFLENPGYYSFEEGITI